MPEGIVNIAEALAHTEEGVPPDLATEMFATPESRRGQFEERATPRVKYTEAQKWQRRMEMAAMQAKGKYLNTIAKHFGVSPSFISQEITALVNEFRAEALKSVGERVAAEEALIYMVQLEAIQAWFESKEGKLIHTKKKVNELRGLANFNKKGKGKSFGERFKRANVDTRINDGLDEIFGSVPDDPDVAELEQMLENNSKDEETTRTEQSAGDPAFLKIIIECSKYRAELNALFPKSGTSGSGGRPEDEERDFNAWSPQKRVRRLNDLLEMARQRDAKQKAISQATSQATATQLNRAPLQSMFQQRAAQMAQGQLPPKAQKVPVTVVPLDTQSKGDPDWDAS